MYEIFSKKFLLRKKIVKIFSLAMVFFPSLIYLKVLKMILMFNFIVTLRLIAKHIIEILNETSYTK